MAFLSRYYLLTRSCFLLNILDHTCIFMSGVHTLPLAPRAHPGRHESEQASGPAVVPDGYFSEGPLWLTPSPSRVQAFTKGVEKINIYIPPPPTLVLL